MSEDEVFALIVSVIASLVCWVIWYRDCLFVARFGNPTSCRTRLSSMPVVCLGLFYLSLRLWASHDVRDSFTYLGFYTVMGMAWVGVFQKLLPWFGLCARDDVVERGNSAAATAIAGALIGLTLCFTGGNMGDGPGWWVVVFSGGLSTVAFFAAWMLVARATGLVDTITIERDSGAGVRTAAFFVAAGLILGRAVAGDWVSAGATMEDFAILAWPVVLLVAIVIPIERKLKPRFHVGGALESPALMPAALYLGLAVTVLVVAGFWK